VRAGSVRCAAIVPAAGRGERLGPGAPKALRTIADAPILLHAVRGLLDSGAVDLVVVAPRPRTSIPAVSKPSGRCSRISARRY